MQKKNNFHIDITVSLCYFESKNILNFKLTEEIRLYEKNGIFVVSICNRISNFNCVRGL